MQLPEHADVLDYTEGLCPICLKVVEAKVIAGNGAVYLKKMCPDHGPSKVHLWPDVDHYQWMRSFRLPFIQPNRGLNPVKGCPSDCGLCSTHLRHSTLVEIEVTQRCNLRCPVCFMSAGKAPTDPSLETIESMYAAILDQSGAQTSIQLTGGEPTVRRELPEIVRIGRRMGFSAIEINTNGLVIGRDPEYIRQLSDAGISGVYLQFDGLTEPVYEKIRGEYLLQDKLQAIERCRAAGVQVVLAMTVVWGINHDQVGGVLDFALRNLDVVAGVAFQPAFTSGRFEPAAERRLTMGDVVFMLAEQSHGLIQPYDLWPLSTSHPLCSCGTYLVHDGKSSDGDAVEPVTRRITQHEYMQRYNPHSPQGSVFADILAQRGDSTGSGLSVVVMNYMDAMTMDLKRLKECSMTVTMEDGRLVPFCAYQLTNMYEDRLYPIWGRPESASVKRGDYA
jgi:7,8-dihydro-6-hydroxymethylpterin dimethyltransferase